MSSALLPRDDRTALTLSPALDGSIVHLCSALLELALEHPFDDESDLTENEHPRRVLYWAHSEQLGVMDVLWRQWRPRENVDDVESREGK